MIPLREDDGITLIELIVYIVLSTLIMAGLGMLFASGLREQGRAAERDKATGVASLISSSLADIRNAAWTSAVETAQGPGIVAAIISGDGKLTCRAWIVADGDLLYHAVPVPSIPASAPLIDLATVSQWGRLNSRDIEGNGRVTGTLSTEPASRAINVDLTITVGDAEVSVKNIVTAQAVVEGKESFTCLAS